MSLTEHERWCKRLMDTDDGRGHNSLQRLMWMRQRAERRVRASHDPKEQSEAASDFHAFDAAIKAIKATGDRA